MASADSQIKESQKIFDFDIKEYPIKWYIDKFKENYLTIPDYRRSHDWDEIQQSGFIEIVLLNIPIQPIYTVDVCEDDNFFLEIIDGTERISALCSFSLDEIELTELSILDTLDGSCFKDLSRFTQKRFLETPIRMIQFADSNIAMEIYERINLRSKRVQKLTRDFYKSIK